MSKGKKLNITKGRRMSKTMAILAENLPPESEVDKLVEDLSIGDDPIIVKLPGEIHQVDIKASFDFSEGEDRLKKHFFRQFMDNEISCDEYKKLCDDDEIRSWTENDMGKIPNVDYPCRHDFKKKENIFQKVVKWWRN